MPLPTTLPAPVPRSRRSPPAAMRPAWPLASLPLLAALALTACGGGGAGPAGTPAPVADDARAASLAVSQPGEVVGYVRERLRQRPVPAVFAPTPVASPAPAPAPASASPGGVTADVRSGTTVQEAGVDEADLIKSSGPLIFTLDHTSTLRFTRTPPTLNVHRRLSDGRIEPASTLTLPTDPAQWSQVRGLLMSTAAARLAVVGEASTPYSGPLPCTGAPGALIDCPVSPGPAPLPAPGVGLTPFPGFNSYSARVQTVEVSSTGVPGVGTRLDLSGRLVGTRQIGNLLYLVTTHTPALAIDRLPAGATQADRDAAIAQVSAAEILPTISTDGGPAEPLVRETDCWLQGANASTGIAITTITSIDLASTALTRRSRCIVGGTEALYVSPQSVVLATTRYTYTGGSQGGGATTTEWRYPLDITTDLHRFTLAAGSVDYRGSGTVKGHLGWDDQRKPYRISEHNGDLRVLTFTGEVGWGIVADTRNAASPATLTILRERTSDRTLQVVSQLPNARRSGLLGRAGEQVYAVRFLGDRGYLVTFRQIDPLYVLDLSNPDDPFVAGELEVPGFSDYLFPLANGLLFGVGKDVSAAGQQGGVKVSLFDVRNPANPRELATRSFGQRGSISGLDASSNGINLLETGSQVRIALPLVLLGNNFRFAEQGLQRIEVDTAAGTLSTKPLIKPPAPAQGNSIGIAGDRSVQIGSQVYYLSDGRLTGWDW